MDYLTPDTYWLNSTPTPPSYPPLDGDIEADIAIVGAGITGLTAAYALKRRGMKVAVIEAGRVAGGTSGGTSGHLDASPEVSAGKLKSAFGVDAARQVVLGRERAIKVIETNAAQFGDCDFRRVPAYLFTERPENVESLEQEMRDCGEIGLTVTASRQIGVPFSIASAICFPNQGRVHVGAYLRGLANAVHGNGSAIYEHTRAKPPEGGSPAILATERGTVKAKSIFMATHSAYLGLSAYDTRVAPYQSYVIQARVEKPSGDVLLWDDHDPYHYIRQASSADPHVLLIGGADHKTGQRGEDDPFEALEGYARLHFGAVQVEKRWSSEFFAPSDGLPFVGAVPLMENVFFATGFGGEGLTYGPMAGQLFADLVQGHENLLAPILSPARVKPLAAALDFAKENLNVAKEFLTGYLSGTKVDSLEEIPRGEGKVVVYRDERIAVYRDRTGQFHACSPICTHAGCVVNWNGLEKTWDCPCHGGRYSPTGERLYGPPSIDLERKLIADA